MHEPLVEKLHDPAAQKMWSGYLRTLRKAGRKRGIDDWDSFENDIAEHAAAAFSEFDGPEVDRLRSALAQIGAPQTVAKAFISEATPRKTTEFERATSKLSSVISLLLTSILAVVALIAMTMGAANIFNPEVGVWLHGDGTWSLSFEGHSDSRQLLRRSFSFWAFLTAGAMAGLVYAIRREP